MLCLQRYVSFFEQSLPKLLQVTVKGAKLYPNMSILKKIKSYGGGLICVFGFGCVVDKLGGIVVCRGVSMNPIIQDAIVIGETLFASPRLWSRKRQCNWIGKETVPVGQCYVLGDNAQSSNDSRSFGSIPLEMKNGFRRFVYVIALSSIFSQFGMIIRGKGSSMHPAVQDGDVILSCPLNSKSRKRLHRGDIVCVVSPIDPTMLLGKRLIYKPLDPVSPQYFFNLGRARVPAGHCFILGDNSASSTDSRDFGSVPVGLIKYRMVLRIWPLDRIGWLSKRWFFDQEDV
uniref:Peptidase S26 domain-containing protein n=1 Tax=Ditylenchus dipsaci TaxID=166011 RepID=A0A915EBM9_9BILA